MLAPLSCEVLGRLNKIWIALTRHVQLARVGKTVHTTNGHFIEDSEQSFRITHSSLHTAYSLVVLSVMNDCFPSHSSKHYSYSSFHFPFSKRKRFALARAYCFSIGKRESEEWKGRAAAARNWPSSVSVMNGKKPMALEVVLIFPLFFIIETQSWAIPSD